MDSILNQQDDEIYVYYNASKEDAVKINKRRVTAERLAIIFNVRYSIGRLTMLACSGTHARDCLPIIQILEIHIFNDRQC